MLTKVIYFFLLLFLNLYVFAQQIPVGAWRTHLSYRFAHALAVTPEKIYVGTDHGVFYFDKQSGEVITLSKIDGLSAIQVADIIYSDTYNMLLIVYMDGQLDVVKDNKTFPVSTLKNSLTINDKIHHVMVYHDKTYISTTAGLFVFYLPKMEIKEVYSHIGSDASVVNVYSSAIWKDTLYLSTNQGLKFVPLNPFTNLLDYNSWTKLSPPAGVSETAIVHLSTTSKALYAGISDKGIYQYSSSQWIQTPVPKAKNIFSIYSSEDKLVIIQDNNLVFYTASGYSLLTHSLFNKPRKAFFEKKDGAIWIADEVSGLVRYTEQLVEQIRFDVPLVTPPNRLSYVNGKIIMWENGYDVDYNPSHKDALVSIFENGRWRNVILSDYFSSPIKDITAIASGMDQSTIYYATFQNGIIKQSPDGSFQILDQLPITEISSVVMDKQNKLWISDLTTSAFLHCQPPDAQLQSFMIENNASMSYPLQIVIDDNGYKWLRMGLKGGGGMLLYDDQKGQYKYINDLPTQGKLPSRQVYDLVVDKEGMLWIATEKGIATILSSPSLFSSSFESSFPVYEGRPLLKNQPVYTIAVDGANQKWLGTENGLWLVSQNGDQIIAHFTTENSPLLSNKIIDLEWNPVTGELFISTDKGLSSYRTPITEPLENFKVKIFPNPISVNYKGVISITGLPDQSLLKITDISGRLITQLYSTGGTATLSIQQFDSVAGIYLVMIDDQKNKTTIVSKIAIVAQ